jgi:hypothetical protein
MKILPFIALFSVLIFTSSYVSSKIDTPAQTTAKAGSFKQFIVHRQGADVALSWSVAARDVAEFAIERSYDGEFFDTIGTMSCTGTTTHRYKDVSVFPGTVWYRISAIKVDDSVETSLVQSVRIVKRG